MNKTRILIVEDEGIIADDIADTLGILGYEVVGIESTGQGAIASAGVLMPDIILMDIVLQGELDGVETARLIRKNLNIPVIFLTAYASESILESLGDIDPFGYLIKPFENRELHFTIQMALFKKHTEDELRTVNKTLKTLSECNNALVHAADETGLLNDICRIVIENGGYTFAWICYMDEETTKSITPVAWAGNDNGFLSSLGISPSIDDERLGPTSAAIRSSMPLSFHSTTPEGNMLYSALAELGFHSALALPLVSGHSVLGILTILSSDPARFEQVEFDLLTELSNNLSYWLSSVRSRKAQIKAEEAQTAINMVSQLLLSSDDMLTAYRLLPEILAEKLHFPFVSIEITDQASHDGTGAGRYNIGQNGKELPPIQDTPASQTISEGRSVLVDRIMQRNDYSYSALKALGADIFVSVPIMTKGAIYGSISVADTGHRETQSKAVTLQLISNQVAQQIERKKDAHAIQQSHERFIAVMDSLEALVYVADMQTHEMLFANKYLRDFFIEELADRKCWQILHNDMTGPCGFCTNKYLLDADGTPTGVYRWELNNKKNNRWYDVRDRAIRWIDGRLVRLEIATDITERKLAEEELKLHREQLTVLVEERTAKLITANKNLQHEIAERKRAEEELLKTQRLESMAILAGGIAHDFNNILTSILSSITLAKLSMDPGGDVYRRLSVAEKASLRARDLTQQLLTFSKSGSPVKKTASIIDLIIDSAEFVLRGSNVKCKYQFDDNLWHVDIDEGQISQVISNLLINANQAMPQGGTITITAKDIVLAENELPTLPAGRYVLLSVKDQGVGISEKDLPLIFDPYFTTKQAGSGLGLASTYSIIKKHDGNISVETRLNEGTTFTIYLPASDGKAVTVAPLSQRVHMGSGRLLVMDDDPSIRESLGEALRFLGYDVQFAEDGSAALEQYEEALNEGKGFDAVIMDLTIPGGMGGLEAIARLRKLDPSVKAIVSSGYSNAPVMSSYKEYGFNGMISKPYKIEELSQIIHETLAGQTTGQ